MLRGKKNSYLVGLDIGTTKICALVAHVSSEQQPKLVGIGMAPSLGLKKGVIINIETTVKAINEAIFQAQKNSGQAINSVYCGIAGSHIRGLVSQGVVAIKNGEVNHKDVQKVIDAAGAIALSRDRQIFHILPNEFIVDGQDGIKEPVGMSGVRLECRVHIVTGSVSSSQNILKCAQKCGVEVKGVVLEQLASAYAVLSEDEKNLGVILVDIGGGTTDIAIFFDGSIQYTAVIPIGGQHFTNDIAIGLRTPQECAEQIKIRYGLVSKNDPQADEEIEVQSIGEKPDRLIKKHIVHEILGQRVKETFELVAAEVTNSGFDDLLASGMVITGGSSLLPGIIDLAEEVIGVPSRLGVPRGVGGLMDIVKNPIYATAVGLVLYGQENSKSKGSALRGKFYQRVHKKISSWFNDII